VPSQQSKVVREGKATPTRHVSQAHIHLATSRNSFYLKHQYHFSSN